jgi:hypothetical protein
MPLVELPNSFLSLFSYLQVMFMSKMMSCTFLGLTKSLVLVFCITDLQCMAKFDDQYTIIRKCNLKNG